MASCVTKNRFRICAFAFVAGGLLLAGCRDHDGVAPRLPENKKKTNMFNASQLGKDRKTTLAALRQSQHSIFQSLGPHRITAASTLKIWRGKAKKSKAKASRKKTLKLTLSLLQAKDGAYSISKNTDPQYGQHVIWHQGFLYTRLRYNPWTKRRPVNAREPRVLRDRLVSFLPAYVELLAPHMTIRKSGQTQLFGRQAHELTLSLGRPKSVGNKRRSKAQNASEISSSKDNAVNRAPARIWRRSIVVSKLTGKVLLDTKTGVPLKVSLAAQWSFVLAEKPGATGIPQGFDEKRRGETSLQLTQTIEPTAAVSIAPPTKDKIVDPYRRRLEIERQMVVGERSVDPNWSKRDDG
jgi:hypothetical protein